MVFFECSEDREFRKLAIFSSANGLKETVLLNVSSVLVADVLLYAIDSFLEDVERLMDEDLI